MGKITDLLKQKKILISDGAWGTFLYKKGLVAGDCPELWNVTHAQDVFDIAKSYVDAGSDIILTNSFGGTPKKLSHYGLQDKAAELNAEAAKISRRAAQGKCLVLGSMGPTGAMLLTEEISEQEMYDGFYFQAKALQEGGVDGLCIETMSALDEACIAIKAARDATGLEIACTFTFNRGVNGLYRTMMGVSPEEMAEAITEAGASIIGTNCGSGFDQMIDIVAILRSVNAGIPILVHANAGLPVVEDGQIVYPETPSSMASKVWKLIESGAGIIGGCCGTTPEHIAAFANAVAHHQEKGVLR